MRSTAADPLLEYWNIMKMEYWNIGHHGTKVYWYIGILVYWYIGMVYWYIGILETQPPACKHYLFLRFLDPSQVTIADWMPFAYMHT